MNDQISRQKLKPCPFCGGDKIRLTNWGLYRCWCANCLAQAANEISEKDAVEAWNRRVEPPADQWIPCDIAVPAEPVGEYYKDVQIKKRSGEVVVGYYRNDDGEWWEIKGDDADRMLDAVEWRPLPEPYKGVK